MTGQYPLAEVDRIEITTLYDCLVDATAPNSGPARRLRPSNNDPIVSDLLEGSQRRGLVGGHGLSMLVRVSTSEKSRSLLFDAGGSPDALVTNLELLEVNPRDFSAIALSHGHWDHTVGLVGLQRKMGRLDLPLVLHPDAYLRRAIMKDDGELDTPSASLSAAALRDVGLEVFETGDPSYLLEKMVLVTGQVGRTNDFEIGWPAHYALRDGAWNPDPLICDDQGLVMHLRGRGLVVLSGCGHAGIVNTVHHAQAITGVRSVHAVLGGFHLGPDFFANRVDKVVDALVSLGPSLLVPAHCSGVRASMAVARALPTAFVQNTVGTRYTLEAEPREAHRQSEAEASAAADQRAVAVRQRIRELGSGDLELRG